MDSKSTPHLTIDKAEWLTLAIIVRELGHSEPNYPIIFSMVARLQELDVIYQPELFPESNVVKVNFGQPRVSQ